MFLDTDPTAVLARALEAVGVARQLSPGSSARTASLEEAHALASIASAAALIDITLAIEAYVENVTHDIRADDMQLDTPPMPTPWYPNRGDRVMVKLPDEPTAADILDSRSGTIQDLAETEGQLYARVLFDGEPVAVKVWLELIEPEPLHENPNPYIADGDTSGAYDDEVEGIPDEHRSRNKLDEIEAEEIEAAMISTQEMREAVATEHDGDDFPDVTPNPVFAEAVAEAKIKKAKGKK